LPLLISLFGQAMSVGGADALVWVDVTTEQSSSRIYDFGTGIVLQIILVRLWSGSSTFEMANR